MKEKSSGGTGTLIRRLVVSLGAVSLMTSVVTAGPAWAQEPPPTGGTPPATEGAPTAAPPVVAPPPVQQEKPPAMPQAAMPMPMPMPMPMMSPPPPPAPAPPAPMNLNSMKMNVGVRIGASVQGSSDRSKLNDFAVDTIYVESRFSGQVTPLLGWQANFNGGLAGTARNIVDVPQVTGAPMAVRGAVGVMDLIAKLDAHELFHLWAGRLLVPSDRSNFSGPYFMSPWNYPGVYAGHYIGPQTGPTGRDNGVVAWGQVMGGKGKYYLGAFNLQDATLRPLYTGRINICLLGAEDGFYHSSTYYGSQDVVAIGAGYQYQKDFTGPVTDRQALQIFMADLLAEKNLNGAGVGTLEGAYYHFDSGQPFKQGYFILASYLTPAEVGIGKLQPLVRWQQATGQGTQPSINSIDAFVTYVIAGYDARIALGYTHSDPGGGAVKANAIQLGVQLQH